VEDTDETDEIPRPPAWLIEKWTKSQWASLFVRVAEARSLSVACSLRTVAGQIDRIRRYLIGREVSLENQHSFIFDYLPKNWQKAAWSRDRERDIGDVISLGFVEIRMAALYRDFNRKDEYSSYDDKIIFTD
jgi:hypothetical protein